MLCDLVYKYTSKDGFCDKILSDLAEELNTSTRTLSRYVSELMEKNLVDNIGSKSHPKYRTTPFGSRSQCQTVTKLYLLSIKKYVRMLLSTSTAGIIKSITQELTRKDLRAFYQRSLMANQLLERSWLMFLFGVRRTGVRSINLR